MGNSRMITANITHGNCWAVYPREVKEGDMLEDTDEQPQIIGRARAKKANQVEQYGVRRQFAPQLSAIRTKSFSTTGLSGKGHRE